MVILFSLLYANKILTHPIIVNTIKGRFVNAYKFLRLTGKGHDISYTVHCHKNAHGLYDLVTDRVQMKNLHPTAPAREGGQNAFDAGEKTLASFPIPELLKRIDAALLVLKSCNGTDIPCHKPWAQLHPNGDVKNLRDAMQDRWDDNYSKLYEDYQVGFTKCYKNGRLILRLNGHNGRTMCP